VFVGHYAPAYLLKSRYREAPLWLLFLGVQFVDILFFLFVPMGIEHMHIVPEAKGSLLMSLDYMPFTHSLMMGIVYMAVFMAVGELGDKPRLGIALGLAVFSHWILDWLTHTPDLPLGLAAAPKFGLGLWRYHGLSFLVEIGLLVACYAVLRPKLPVGSARKWGDIVLIVLVVVQTTNDWVLPPPASTTALAISGEAAYIVLALLAGQIDRRIPQAAQS